MIFFSTEKQQAASVPGQGYQSLDEDESRLRTVFFFKPSQQVREIIPAMVVHRHNLRSDL